MHTAHPVVTDQRSAGPSGRTTHRVKSRSGSRRTAWSEFLLGGRLGGSVMAGAGIAWTPPSAMDAPDVVRGVSNHPDSQHQLFIAATSMCTLNPIDSSPKISSMPFRTSHSSRRRPTHRAPRHVSGPFCDGAGEPCVPSLRLPVLAVALWKEEVIRVDGRHIPSIFLKKGGGKWGGQAAAAKSQR